MTPVLGGKVAVVTGGARGVGRAYAHRLAEQGAKVVVNDLPDGDHLPADEVVSEIKKLGGDAIANGHSVAEYAGSKALMEAAVETFGRLDILIANAGIIRPAYILDADESDWADVLAVHATGTFNSIRHAAPHMLKVGGGSIITTADIQTEVWFPRISSYRAAKAAIAILTQHAANEFRELNINVNSVMPGATETRMAGQFLASLGDQLEGFVAAAQAHYDTGEDEQHVEPAPPESVPPVGVFLCSDAARSLTGHLFQMSGHAVGVVEPSVETTWAIPDGDQWTAEELETRIPNLLAEKRSLLRG
jgi:NAD(P)-dependent dehydrogenase (short-subunit alcohol dehydrogenase family)